MHSIRQIRLIRPIRALAGRGRRESGFAILMVVLVLVGLIIIGAPFAISMRQQELASVNFAARTHAKLVANGALNLAKAQLERSHEFYEHLEAQTGRPPTMFNSDYVDSGGELRVNFADAAQLGFDPAALANPAGAMWSARAEDEQGKINVKTAPGVLLRNLLLEVTGETFDPAAPDATRAAQIAGEIVNYRRGHPLTSLAQLRTASTTLTEAEYQRLTRFLTVHSAPFVSETSTASVTQYPVNINTCPAEVLRALLRGVRLRQSGAAEELHKGVGYDTRTLDRDGDGTDETYTDNFDALIARLRVFAKLAASVATDSTTVTLDNATLLPQPLQSADGNKEVDGYWVSIEGDVVRYWKKEGASLSVSASADYAPTCRVDVARAYDALEPAEVRLVFADLAHDLGGVLEDLVKEGKLTPDSKAAIRANAINPRNTTVLDVTLDPQSGAVTGGTTTSPLCTHSFNIYTIEATGVMNAPDGRELARYTVTQVAQVAPTVELDLRIDRQVHFEQPFNADMAKHQATWPNATQVRDIAPRTTEPPEAVLIPRHGRLGLLPVECNPADPVRFPWRFSLPFNGPLQDDVLKGATGSVWPEPFKDLTTARTEPGDDSDLTPEGIHVGKVELPDGTFRTGTLVYHARAEGKDAEGKTIELNNVPHSGFVVQPLVVEMWVKFDSDPKVGGSPRFDYSLDRVLFDLGQQSWSNRLVLMYYGRDGASGDIVLHVCDSTNQPIAAQVRCRVGRDSTPPTRIQLLPDRWYHVVMSVKGIRYNEMGLFINGRSVGRYFPVARTTGAAADAASIPCTGAATDDPNTTSVFRLQPWPVAGPAYGFGEIFEYIGGVNGAFSIMLDGMGKPIGRGSRGTQARVLPDGARIELHGYVDYIHKDNSQGGYQDVEHLLDGMMAADREPFLLADLPASFPQATVDDADETNPTGAPAPTTSTADGTNQFWNPSTDCYQAWTGNPNNTIPSSDWLPLFASEKWIVPSAKDRGAIADDQEKFDTVLANPGFLSMLTWTVPPQRPSIAARVVEDATDGIGLVTLEALDPTKPLQGAEREAIKFSKAGVVLVWRYHPDDVDDPKTPEDDRRQIAWYIGYIAGFDETATAYAGCRACFGTTRADIVEGAKLRLDCIKLSSNHDLPRGHRGVETITHELVGTDATVDELVERKGLGIFQIGFRSATEPLAIDVDPNKFEWIQFVRPIFPATYVADEDRQLEEKILAHKFLYGITRCAANTGDSTTAPRSPVPFPAKDAKIMPVFFCSGYIHVMDKDIDLVKGSHDEVTLTDNTGQREDHWVHHGWGRMFAFRESISITKSFVYANRPRLLKFPSSMPIKPDRYSYLGSDTMYKDGDPAKPATDGGGLGTGEPERPANATFDEVKIHSAALGIARLWDCKLTGGAPSAAKEVRDFGGIPAAAAPPFYIRIGNLEEFSPQGATEPYRFHHNGHVGSWPLEGYAKIDDEVVFYRVVYRRPEGRTSAPIKLTGGSEPDANGLITVLSRTGTSLYLDLTEEEAKDFPDMGYLTISNAWANLKYWETIKWIMGTYGVTWDAIEADIQKGEEVRNAKGELVNSSDHIGHEERVFFSGKRYDAGKGALEITLTHRGILDSTAQKVQMYDPALASSWFLDTDGKSSSASVSVISVELLILERASLGTAADAHALGARVNPLDHIHCALAPRKMIKLQRDEFGRLLLEDGRIKALADDDARFDISKPEYEYGIVVEYHDNFPAEGYVQIGNEILGYAQDRSGGSPIWTARLPDPTTTEGYRDVPVLTGIKLLRQRYGTSRASYLEDALAAVDPQDEEPRYYSFADDFASGSQPFYRRIVRLREARYHDRYPISNTGEFTPHRASAPVGYWEFAYSLPGALWSQVKWHELKYDEAEGTLVSSNPDVPGLGSKPLTASDPWDVQVLVQLDNAPAWDDTANDPATSKPVAQPVRWDAVPGRADVVYSPPGYRLKKPVIYLFDDPAANNYINAKDSSTPLGQYADRIRLRVYFKYNDYPTAEGSPPNYNIPWRTPWVDTITLKYKAPTRVLEHREMPY